MRLKNIALVLTVTIAATLPASAAKTAPDTISARKAFIELPMEVLDMLPRETRLDMLDYFDADSIYVATNNLDGKSKLKTVTPDFLEVQITEGSTLQVKVLRCKDGNDVVMTLYTTGEPGGNQDTKVQFLDPKMNLLQAKRYLPEPRPSDYFEIPKGCSTSMKEIEGMIPFYSFVYEAEAGSPEVRSRLCTDDILTVEDAALVELFKRPEIIYIWNGKQFRKK